MCINNGHTLLSGFVLPIHPCELRNRNDQEHYKTGQTDILAPVISPEFGVVLALLEVADDLAELGGELPVAAGGRGG